MSARWPGDPEPTNDRPTPNAEPGFGEPKEPTGDSPKSPYRTTLGVFFWILGLGGGLVAIIAWFVDTQGLLWFELGRSAAGFGITSGVLWLVVSALTWKPRD